MFTGIVEEIGQINAVTPVGDGVRLQISAQKVVADTKLGDSICVNGVCLTVVDFSASGFAADVMKQTLDVSALHGIQSGDAVNLERALRLADRIGGHLVQGHVDAVGRILEIRPGEAWQVLRISLPSEVGRLVVDKGSITVQGVSLTVSKLGAGWFEVSLIPTTLQETTLGNIQVGDAVNLETDLIARQVQRWLETNND